MARVLPRLCLFEWIGTPLLWAGLIGAPAVAQAPHPKSIQLVKREPDYRFRFHTEYRLPGQKPLALALRGGSAKGLAHLGVLQGFDEENLPVDAITGTSAGSLMGSLYASGFSAEGIARIFKHRDFGTALDDRMREAGWSLSEDEIQHASPFGITFRNGHLDLMPGGTRSRRYRASLMPLLGRASWLAGGDFNQLRMPLRVVTSNLTAGRGQVFAQGSLVDVVMASSCLPGIFEPVLIDGHQFVDGGPFENLPILTSRRAFPGMVQVGVAIGRPWSALPKTNLATLLDASLDLSMAQTEAHSAAQADLVVRPDLTVAEEFDFFHQVDALVNVGRQAFELNREALEGLVYGAQSSAIAASGVDLEANGVAGAPAWLQNSVPQGALTHRSLYRLVRRAHRDLPISQAELLLPDTTEGRAILRLRPARTIARLELDLPSDWPTEAKARVRDGLKTRFGLEVGRPFHEGAWSRAIEDLLMEAILGDAPILDLQGSGFREDGTLVLRVREPRITEIRSADPTLQAPLGRFLAPIRVGPVRTSSLEESLARAATRFGISRLRPDLRQEDGNLVLDLNPDRAPSLEFSPHLAYESTWGGHLALDMTAPNFLGSGSPLQLHGAINSLQTRLQGQMMRTFSVFPRLGFGLAGSLQKQWLPLGDKVQKGDFGFRTQLRYGMEDRGLVQVDLGRTEDRTTLLNIGSETNRATYARLASEWDSFDSHTLPTRGLMVRTTWVRGFPTEPRPAFTTGYLRVRHLWTPPEASWVPFGLDLDAETGIQDHAPAPRWFIVGGADSLIGTRSAYYLAPNFGVLRLGLPFTATTLFGVAIQCVPRFDRARIAVDYRHPEQGLRMDGYGLVLRGVLKSLYVELAGGKVITKELATGARQTDRHISFLIGTRPFDLWKGR